ncbi:ATP-binding cassette domain-containing protein [Geoanaerobacter pelophilus]|uniref:ATP-binding cassette domain-containing protein n=1 Tax=Geoanaerobacter pelophilus TaxID=60036 RepID=UPI00307EC51C
MTTVLTADSLSKSFGEVKAVDGLTLQVKAGELFGLVGSDGAGKTTTIRMLAGVLDTTSGSATVLDHPCSSLDAIRGEIGYMSQRFGLYPDLTVGENIQFYADIFGLSKSERSANIERLLNATNLGAFRQRKAGNLSGGMKQKLGLACALIHTPKILFLDEPTNGVDPVSRREFWRLLYALLDEGVTIFVATAYLDEADRCHRVGLIHNGKLIACDTPGNLRNLAQAKILEIVSASPKTADRLLRTAFPDAAVMLFGDRIHLSTVDPEPMAAKTRQLLTSGQLEVYSIEEVEPSLEDIFVAMVSDRESPVVGNQLSVAVDHGQELGAKAVSVTGLTRRFGDFVAVKGIDLEVEHGEIFGFLGPNGAGKSTTIRMLCGILEPTSGSGRVAGCDIRTGQEEIKKRIGYMSQKFSLYEELTVEENIAFYGGIYRLSGKKLTERGDWAITMAGLEQRRTAIAGELSGGWKQRLALGCALLHEPPVIFLDEPTAGVDPLSRRAFWRLIRSLAAGGVTVFVTTHYMDEAEYCDRLAMIHQGEMVALGTPQQLKQEKMSEIVLEASCDRPQEILSQLEQLPAVRHAALYGRGAHLVTEDQNATENGLLGSALAGRVTLRAVIPSLEDLFVSLIEARERTATAPDRRAVR